MTTKNNNWTMKIFLILLTTVILAAAAYAAISPSPCSGNVCSKTITVGGNPITYYYTEHVAPNGMLKVRFDDGSTNTNKVISYAITELPSFSTYGKYAAPGSYALPSEEISAITYKTQDDNGYSGDIDMVQWVGFSSLAPGEYNIKLSITHYGANALESITFYVDANAPLNDDESYEFTAITGDNTCADNTDNDLDYYKNCADSDCIGELGRVTPAGICQAVESTCDDNFDNDADTKTDCADSDCNGLVGGPVGQLCQYPDENSAGCIDDFDNDADGRKDCVDNIGTIFCWKNDIQCPATETDCSDGIDNDNDQNYVDDYDSNVATGKDCADYDCAGDPNCPLLENKDKDDIETPEQCFNGVDDDLDLLTDCADADCTGIENPANPGEICYPAEFSIALGIQVCNNGIDDDGDGDIDCADSDCWQMFGSCGPCPNIENIFYSSCADTKDNDYDGLKNCADSDCLGEFGSLVDAGRCELIETDCDDLFDNDNDGLKDCRDPDCDGLTGPDGQICGAEDCADGDDNDGDNARDCVDTNCFGTGTCALKDWVNKVCISVPSWSGFQIFGAPNQVSARQMNRLYINDQHQINIKGTGTYSSVTIIVGNAVLASEYYPYDATSCVLSGTGASQMTYTSTDQNVGQIINNVDIDETNPIVGFDVTLTCNTPGTPQAAKSYPIETLFQDEEKNPVDSGEKIFTTQLYENTVPTVSEVEVGGIVGTTIKGTSVSFRAIPTDSSGICKCDFNLGGTLKSSTSGNCIVSQIFSDDIASFTIQARATDGAANTGSYSTPQIISINVPAVVSSVLTLDKTFYKGTDTPSINAGFKTASSGNFDSTNCDVTIRDSSGLVVSSQTAVKTGTGNSITCSGAFVLPFADGQYTIEVSVTDEDTDSITTNKKIFYKCDGVAGECQFADMDQDSAVEGVEAIYTGKVCDNCPDLSNLNQYDTNADGIGDDCNCVDEDSDGYSPNGGDCGLIDCDDNNNAIHPGATEVCNDADDDCDGTTDAFSQSCGANACAGTQTCIAGVWDDCSTEGTDCGICCVCTTGTETYDEVQDADCTETTCPADGCGVNGCTENIWGDYPDNVANECASLGACTANTCDGTSTCEADVDLDTYSPTCGDCNDDNNAIYPRDPSFDEAAEGLCNGDDDDCDGTPDENCGCSIGQTQVCGTGPCEGTQTCDAYGLWGDCSTDTSDCGTCCTCQGGSETYDESQDLDCSATTCPTDECGADGCGTNIWGDYPDNVANECASLGACTENTCEGAATCETDVDLDTYSPTCGDCNDNDNTINPGETETCGDGIDKDCDTLDSNTYNLGAVCGSGVCQGNLACDGLFATRCDTDGFDAGTCALCDAAGIAIYDETQDADCIATDCPLDACGVNGCGVNIWGDYPDNVANECTSINTCTANTCDGTSTCEADVDLDTYSPTCGDCNDDNNAIYPRDPSFDEAAEGLCNGDDDDCDGTPDENCICEEGQVQSCGTNACVGTQTCSNYGIWGACSTEGTDCGTCCTCQGGSETYDESQDIDCADVTCPLDACGANGCGANIWGDYPDIVQNDCSALGVCTTNNCIGAATCEADGDGDGYSVSCGDCDDAESTAFPRDPSFDEAANGMCDGHDNDCDGTVDEGGCSVCGNGVLEAPEICDDGNLIAGDGCSPTCQVETIEPCSTSQYMIDNGDGTYTYRFFNDAGVLMFEVENNVGLLDLFDSNCNLDIQGSWKESITLEDLNLSSEVTKSLALVYKNYICAVDNDVFIASNLGNWDCGDEPDRIIWTNTGPNKNLCGEPGSPTPGKDLNGNIFNQYTCEKFRGIDNKVYAKISGFTHTSAQSVEDADEDGYHVGVDCDDNNPFVNPGQAEVCDGIDNNCDDIIDYVSVVGDLDNSCGADSCEGTDTFFDYFCEEGVGCATDLIIEDIDNDGFNGLCTDCNDNNNGVFPGAQETCPDNGIDNNCDGTATFDCEALCDADGDTYYDEDKWWCFGSDCDDGNANIYPGAIELCNGLDDDCSGIPDDLDADNDNFNDCDGTDKCFGTVLPDSIPTIELKPNHQGGSSVWRGCSCEQILECKPGNDYGEFKYGCSPGTINVWVNQEGWSAECQELTTWGTLVVKAGEPKSLDEDTDGDGELDITDLDDDNDGIEDSQDAEPDSAPEEAGQEGSGKPDWWCKKHPTKC